MAQKNMNARFVQKHDIEANWNKASNFYPLAGQIIIYDPDENYDYPRFKVGIWDGKEPPTEDMLVINLPFATVEQIIGSGEGVNSVISTNTNNVALGEASTAMGSDNIAGSHVFDILDIDVKNNTFTLSSAEGLDKLEADEYGRGEKYSCHLNHTWSNVGKITGIQPDPTMREVVKIGQDGRSITYDYVRGDGSIVCSKTIPAIKPTYISPATAKPFKSANLRSDGLSIDGPEAGFVYERFTVFSNSSSNDAIKFVDAATTGITANGGRYFIVKIRMDSGWTTTWGGLVYRLKGGDEVVFGGGFNAFKHDVYPNDEWKVVVFDLGEAVNGQTIVSLYFNWATLVYGAHVDVAYAAFCDSWSEIDAIINEATVLQASYNEGKSWAGTASKITVAENINSETPPVNTIPVVSGVWVWNESIKILLDMTEHVTFEANGVPYIDIGIDGQGDLLMYGSADDNVIVYNGPIKWISDSYRTIDFGTTPQGVSQEFYTFLTDNATYQPSAIEQRWIVTVDTIPASAKMHDTYHTFWISGRPDLGDIIIGSNAFAEGLENKAQNEGAHVEGYDNIASGKYSHAENRSNEASGYCSSVRGRFNKANGFCSSVDGEYNEANGDDAYAKGNKTKANGQYSSSEGLGTIADGWAQHVQGVYNSPDPNMAHIVGKGFSDIDRRNIHTLDWSGNAWYAGEVSAKSMTVDGKKVLVEGDAIKVDVLGEIASADSITVQAIEFGNEDESCTSIYKDFILTPELYVGDDDRFYVDAEGLTLTDKSIKANSSNNGSTIIEGGIITSGEIRLGGGQGAYIDASHIAIPSASFSDNITIGDSDEITISGDGILINQVPDTSGLTIKSVSGSTGIFKSDYITLEHPDNAVNTHIDSGGIYANSGRFVDLDIGENDELNISTNGMTMYVPESGDVGITIYDDADNTTLINSYRVRSHTINATNEFSLGEDDVIIDTQGVIFNEDNAIVQAPRIIATSEMTVDGKKVLIEGGANIWRCIDVNSQHGIGNPWCYFDDIADFDENKAKVGDIIIDAEGTVLEIVEINLGRKDLFVKKIGCGYAEINVPFTYWEGYVQKNFDEGNIHLSILTSQVTNDESRLPREGELLIDTWGNWFFICSVDVDNNTAFVKKLVPTDELSTEISNLGTSLQTHEQRINNMDIAVRDLAASVDDIEASVGDIEIALNAILDIQNQLIGGEIA